MTITSGMRLVDEIIRKAALRAGGCVAVVGSIAYPILTKTLETEILSLFNTQQKFLLVYTISVGILFCLLTAIFMSASKKKGAPSPPQTTTNTTVSIDRTTIGGDFVVGDKTTREK